ncbi:MAG: acetolactate synthase small subunit [Verrucomicrobiota bacterium]
MRYTISVLVENRFGVLARIAGMFSGRGFNIDTLNVGPTKDGLSRITATIIGDESALDQALKQLERLVNVIEVRHFRGDDAVARELIMLKISAGPEKRPEIIQICDIFRAKIIDVTKESVIVEVTGNENKLRAFFDLIEPFGIVEMARTGNVALSRGL